MATLDKYSHSLKPFLLRNTGEVDLALDSKVTKVTKALYTEPEKVLFALKSLERRDMEYKGQHIYLFENPELPEILALIDSKSNLSETDVYGAIFTDNNATVGVYVRTVVGLTNTMNGLNRLLEDSEWSESKSAQ